MAHRHVRDGVRGLRGAVAERAVAKGGGVVCMQGGRHRRTDEGLVRGSCRQQQPARAVCVNGRYVLPSLNVLHLREDKLDKLDAGTLALCALI